MHVRSALFVVVLALVVLPAVACGGDSGDSASDPPPATLPSKLQRLYDYDASKSPAARQVGVREEPEADIHDIVYSGPKGDVTAYVIVPKRDGPFPAVVFMHPAPGNRLVFYEEALELAKQGILSILPDAPHARPPRPPVLSYTAADGEQFIQTVVELRRAVDVLMARDDVDKGKLGFVGYSWGAAQGAALAGVERRIGSFILMSTVPNLSERVGEVAERSGAKNPRAYKKTMADLDAVRYLPHVAPNAVLLQFGSRDTAPSPAEAKKTAEATSEPKKVLTYDGGHNLNPGAANDRIIWLREQFGLGN
jgi:pimeloyl-ACP methyl ester carboxylesterase